MTTPHADLVAPGTWWLRGTRGANVYLVEADDGSLVLVDTGFRGPEILARIGDDDGTAALALDPEGGDAGEIRRRGLCVKRHGHGSEAERDKKGAKGLGHRWGP